MQRHNPLPRRSARSARAAIADLRAAGVKVGLFRPITLWPFPEAALAKAASHVRALFVVEMNMGQMILEVERLAKGRCEVVGINRVDSEPIHPQEIMNVIEKYK